MGHYRMIEYAMNKYDSITVVVYSRNGEHWDGELRKKWIDEAFNHSENRVRVVHIPMDYCDPYNEHSWDVWIASIKSIEKDITHFVSSENYGLEVAKRCEWDHDMYDIDRQITSISGTKLRLNPIDNWEYLPSTTKTSLITKIAIIGAESTGKSTLTRNLSRYYQANFVEEYGREYCLYKDLNQLTERDLCAIYEEQKRREYTESKVSQSGVLFCDTEVLVTRAWSKYLLGFDCLDGVIGNHDFYLITNPKNEWIQDGTRVCDSLELRNIFTNFFISELKKHGKRFIQLPCGFEDAKETAVAILETVFPALRGKGNQCLHQ